MGKVTFLPTPQRRDREVTGNASPAFTSQLRAIEEGTATDAAGANPVLLESHYEADE
jgi:hypothetical protein